MSRTGYNERRSRTRGAGPSKSAAGPRPASRPESLVSGERRDRRRPARRRPECPRRRQPPASRRHWPARALSGPGRAPSAYRPSQPARASRGDEGATLTVSLMTTPRFTGPPPRATVDGWGGPARRAPVQRGWIDDSHESSQRRTGAAGSARGTRGRPGNGSGRAADAVGRARPAGHLGLQDGHAARAARGPRGAGVPDGGRGRQHRAGSGRPQRPALGGAATADRGRAERRRLQQLLARLRHDRHRQPTHVAHRRIRRTGASPP